MQQVQLLGTPRIQDGRSWRDLPLDKRLALLAYLACAEGWVTREKLAYLFWPDVRSDQARINLRQLLARSRALPHAGGLEAEVARLRWRVPSDVAAFRQALAREDWPEAWALYGGDLLSGLELDEASEFMSWLEFERAQLRESYRQAAWRQAERALAASRPDEAARLYERLLAQDPLDEAVVQRYLRLLTHMGAHEQAQRLYQTFAARLKAELGLEPAAATLRLVGAAAQEAPADVAPPGPPERPGLVAPMTSFVGREAELADVARRLTREPCRLLTIVGPGGVGKTRLALRAAEVLAGAFGEVVRVPLETVSTPEAIPLALAAALGLELRGAVEPLGQIVQHLGDREALVLFDNFEHLLGGVLLVQELLSRCPRLRLLVTSRERLRLQAEWLLPLEGLNVPPEGALAVQEALGYDALELLVERARQVAPGFRLSAATLPLAARLCRTLEGLPLGLELCAAWLRVLDIGEVVSALQGSLEALSSDAVDVSARHRSLRAAFEHSWKLLSSAEQRAFRRLAVFQGSFERSAARVVAGVAPAILAALVEKSLLRSAEARYDRHPLVQQFMLEQLSADPDEAERLRTAHARYYLRLLASWKGRLHGPQQPQMLEQLTPERDNLRAAWFRGLQQGWAAACLEALEPLILLHGLQGRFAEGAQLFSRSRTMLRDRAEHDDEHRALLGALHVNLAWFLSNLARFDETVAEAEAGLKLLEDFDPAGGRYRGLSVLGTVAARRGDPARARTLFQEALEQARATRDLWAEALVTGQLGLLELRAGRLDEAKAHFGAALSGNEALGNAPGVVNNLDYLGQLSLSAGDPEAAAAYFERGLALSESSGFRLRLPYLRAHLAAVRLIQNDPCAAADEAARALEVAEELGQRALAAEALLLLGQAALRGGETERAEAYLLRALDLAWALKELPRTLAILLELSALPAFNAEAPALLQVVAAHPATPPAERARAAALAARQTPEPLPSLAEVVTSLLARKRLEPGGSP